MRILAVAHFECQRTYRMGLAANLPIVACIGKGGVIRDGPQDRTMSRLRFAPRPAISDMAGILTQRSIVMRSRLANHFQSVRRQQGLSLAELARMVGYKNATKGCNRIQKFEERGEIHADLLHKLSDVLGIDIATIDKLIEQDRREFVRVWNEWADQPSQPHLVVRLLPAVYKSERLPASVTTLEEAEAFAAETARRWNRRACLTWSRRLSVWFDSEGIVEARTEAVPGEANVPTMRLKGSRRSFQLQHPDTGKVILRLINWPKHPISTRPVSSITNEQE